MFGKILSEANRGIDISARICYSINGILLWSLEC